MQETNFYVLFRYSVGFRLLIPPSNKHICTYNKCIGSKIVAEASLTFAILGFFLSVSQTPSENLIHCVLHKLTIQIREVHSFFLGFE
jgi:hypothetical protein